MSAPTWPSEATNPIADARAAEWEQVIPQYLADVEPLSKESARSHRFAMLVQNLLSVEPRFIESYSTGIEQYLKVKQKDRVLKGEADNLFGNVIIEFEANIPKKLAEAERQLRTYTAILWSQESVGQRTPSGSRASGHGCASEMRQHRRARPTAKCPFCLQLEP